MIKKIVLVIDASLGLWIGIEIIELLIHNFVMSNANRRCTLWFSQRKKTKEFKDQDEDGFANKSLRWNQFAQTKKKNNYYNLEPKLCRNKLSNSTHKTHHGAKLVKFTILLPLVYIGINGGVPSKWQKSLGTPESHIHS
jgi:hypothetical protein